MVNRMTTKFLISIPQRWLDVKDKNPLNLYDVDEFYTKLISTLKSMGCQIETTTVIRELIETDGIFLSHHGNHDVDNVWNIKKGYLLNHLYFDRTGFSGWAEIANNKKLFDDSQNVDIEKATKFFTEFSNNYIQNRTSKMRQSDEVFNIDEPYVFVAGQNPPDMVGKLARIPTRKLMQYVAESFKNSEYKVVIKIHPLEREKGNKWIREEYAFLDCYSNVIITNATIHDIIPNAAGVYTVNSGVGFEALLYLKHVFTSGHCDYHWVTTKLHKMNDIQDTIHTLKEPINKELIIKFMYYMLTEYFVNSNDANSIRKKIELAIKEYNEI